MILHAIDMICSTLKLQNIKKKKQLVLAVWVGWAG